MKVIGSVQRALDILNLFNGQNTELGTTEIAEALKLHKSTTAGLVYSLEANGYLQQNPATRKYRLGFKLIERAAVVFEQLQVRQVAQPHLQALRDQLDESVNLAIRDGMQIVYIERLFGGKTLGIRTEVGRRAHLHSTALGKAIWACLPPAEAQALIARYKFEPVTLHTITEPVKFQQDLNKARECGYALDDEENELGGRCVASPIFDHAGRVVAAVSVSVPISRFPTSEISRFGEMVKETAKAISRGLGYMPRPY